MKIPKIGDKLYCIKDGAMGYGGPKFCVKDKSYNIEYFDESVFSFDNTIIATITDESNCKHGFSILDIINGESEYFIWKSKKNILIEKSYEFFLKKEIINYD